MGLIIRLVLEWPLVQENTVGTGLYSMYGRGHWRWTSTPEEDGVLGGICRSVASPLVEYNTLAPWFTPIFCVDRNWNNRYKTMCLLSWYYSHETRLDNDIISAIIVPMAPFCLLGTSFVGRLLSENDMIISGASIHQRVFLGTSIRPKCAACQNLYVKYCTIFS